MGLDQVCIKPTIKGIEALFEALNKRVLMAPCIFLPSKPIHMNVVDEEHVFENESPSDSKGTQCARWPTARPLSSFRGRRSLANS